MTDELLSAFKKNFDLITTNQGVLFTEIKKLNHMIEQQNKNMNNEMDEWGIANDD